MNKNTKETCRLCEHDMVYYDSARQRDYYRCPQCDSIQLKTSQILSRELEEKVYLTHHNDVKDPHYQAFVSPITNYILNHFSPTDKGMDFGAGTGPVITEMLKSKKYLVTLYDPFFYPNETLLSRNYHYIFACEVIEHFNQPKQSFDQLYYLLRPGGSWIFMTNIFNDQIDFQRWHYKNDETHVIFYTKKTFEYIKEHYQLDELIIQNRLIVFKRKL